MRRGFRRFSANEDILKQDAPKENSCACLGSLHLTNILLMIIAAMVTANVILKAVEDGEAAPMIAEGMQHVRYFRDVAEWGQAVFHNATMEVVANNSTATDNRRRQGRNVLKAATVAAVDGSDPEVAVVRELLDLLIHTNGLMDRVEREGAVERAAALMALTHEIGTSDGALMAGTLLRKGLESLQEGNNAHSQNETEAFMMRIAHIVANADDLSHDMAQRTGPILGKADAMLGRVEEMQMLEYMNHVLTVSSSLLQDLKAANATEEVVKLLEKTDLVLDETRQTLDGVLGSGLTLSLGGGKK